MALPKYSDINASAQTNSSGQHYKEYGNADSNGNPGHYNIYYDGHVQFVADPPPPNSMADSAAAALAPPPAPAAPAPTTASAEPASTDSGSSNPSQPQRPDNNHKWEFNSAKNEWYYEEPHTAQDGSTGYFHVYQDGTRVYVAKTWPDAMSGGTPNSMADSTAGALSAPSAPAVNSSDSMHTNSTAAAPGWSPPAQTAASSSPANPTGGIQAPDSASQSLSPDGGLAFDSELSVASASGGTEALHSSSLHIGGRLANQLTPLNSDGAYTVVTGDTLSGIAEAHNMSLDQVVALNPQIKDPNLILPGQEIKIGGGLDDASFPTTSTYDSAVSAPAQAPEEAQKVGLGGWSDGTSTIPNDPTHGIAAVTPVQTDPLKINDDKQAVQTQV